MNPKIDWYFGEDKVWHKELRLLREIVLDCLLTEELKWGAPCYTFQGSNVLLLHGFKHYCAILFVKGALLTDASSLLTRQTEHVQAARQIRFSNAGQIAALKSELKRYIYEAIEIEKAGLNVVLKKTEAFSVPEEFQRRLTDTAGLPTAFNALTAGRQRAYLLYFSAPKQEKTRQARVEKYVPQILVGKGLAD